MAPVNGSGLETLQTLLEEAGLDTDLDWLAAILFVRNLMIPLTIYSNVDKSRIQQFVLEQVGGRSLSEEAFTRVMAEIEAFLEKSLPLREAQRQLEVERRSMDALIDEMSAFFKTVRSSRNKQEQSLKRFNSKTLSVVKEAPSRDELLRQVRTLLTEFVSEFREEARQWEARAKALERTAQYDGLLTQLYNRRSLDAYLAETVVSHQAHERPLSLMMIDVDHFKQVNDTFGHSVGDDVLRTLAKIVKFHAVQHDGYVARYGGEELVLICPLPLEAAAALAEELRRDVEEYDFQSRQNGKVTGDVLHFTVSVGVAELAREGDAAQLLHAADQAMYQAKRAGRNRVALERENQGLRRLGMI